MTPRAFDRCASVICRRVPKSEAYIVVSPSSGAQRPVVTPKPEGGQIRHRYFDFGKLKAMADAERMLR